MKAAKLLSIAASSGKVGFVYLSGEELLDWGLSAKASKGVDEAFSQATGWMKTYTPQLVLIERLDAASRKGQHTRALIEAIRSAARELTIACQAIRRQPRFPNKYEEAAALAAEYPQIEPWLPRKRRIWEPEPRNIIYFEALALARQWLDGNNSAPGLAA